MCARGIFIWGMRPGRLTGSPPGDFVSAVRPKDSVKRGICVRLLTSVS